MENNNSKEVLLSVLGVAILVVAVVGVSFAAFNFSQSGNVENNITTGTINMTYSEPENGINLVNALPMSDEQGMLLSGNNQYFDFTIDTTINGSGSTTINYAITAVKGESTVDDSAIKVYLTSIDNTAYSEILAPTKISELSVTTGSENYQAPSGEFILTTGTLTNSVSHSYRLRMWVADDFSTLTSSGEYRLKVNVYGAAAAQ